MTINRFTSASFGVLLFVAIMCLKCYDRLHLLWPPARLTYKQGVIKTTQPKRVLTVIKIIHYEIKLERKLERGGA